MAPVSADPLIRRVQEGDQDAFRELFLHYRQDVLRIVVRTLGPTPDLEDIVQECFLHIYRSISRFRGDANFRTWLYRLVTNVARMHLRRKRSRPRLTSVEQLPEVPTRGERSSAPDRQVERGERIRALYKLLEGLSDKKREVLTLHDLEGVSAKDIAEIVDAPVLTVRTRLFYARKELYAAMAGDPILADAVEDPGGDKSP